MTYWHWNGKINDQFNFNNSNIINSKQKCVIEYNKGMIGIDRQNQMLACFPTMRKYMKGYWKIFFYLFDIALFNSYVLFNKIIAKNKFMLNIELK